VIDSLKDYYRSLFEENGDSPQAAQHTSREGQFKRFEILTDPISKSHSIVDVGCGLGEMLRFLRKNNYTGQYLGLDFLPEFITAANSKFKNDSNAEFIEYDVCRDELPEKYHYILMSGIFNNKMPKNQSFMFDTITKLYDKCYCGLAFNALSTHVEYQDDTLYYSNPMLVFDYCKKNLTPFVSLKHDYLTKPDGFPYEYTMFLSKDATF
jgi:SAM-dependent methyltransferase